MKSLNTTNRMISTVCPLVSLAILLCVCGSVSAQSVRLKSKAKVEVASVRLSDIAWCGNLPENVQNTILVKLNAEGQAACLDISHVEQALRSAQINPAKVAFSGSAACLVRRIDNSLQADKKRGGVKRFSANTSGQPVSTIGGYLISSVAEAMHVDADRIDIQFTRGSALMAKDSLDKVSDIECEKAEISQGTCRWRVVFDRDGRKVQRWISGTICIIKKGVVTTGPLKAGQSITGSDVCIGDVADDGSIDYYDKLADVIGRKVRRSLSTAQPVEAGNVDSPVLVRSGREIRVSCGMVNIVAKARDAGKLGEIIRVENTRSGRIFNAVVTGSSAARVVGNGGELQ